MANFCGNCGAPLPEGGSFCPNCGTKVGDTIHYSPQTQPAAEPADINYVPKGDKRQGKSGLPGPVIVLLVVAALVLFNVIRLAVTGSKPTAETAVPSSTPGRIQQVTLATPTPAPTVPPTAESGKTAQDWSTEKLPLETDFDWFYDDLEFYASGGLPDGAEPIRDTALLEGGWMATAYRTNEAGDLTRKEFSHHEITVTDPHVVSNTQWSGIIDNGGDWQDARNGSPDQYSGVVGMSYDGRMVLDMKDYYDISIHIENFFTYGGKQYGVGTYSNPWDKEKTIGYTAFVRP